MTETQPEQALMSTGPTPSTGHPAIDEALTRLERLDELDLSLHPEEFDAVHGVLREALAHAGRDGADVESA